MSLAIAPGLDLPLDAVTETFALLAKRGAGKSNAAVVIAEQMYDAGLPWVAVDPKGDWWGIRSSQDGTGPGLPVLVLGGEHGDVPLESTAGRVVADLIAEQRLTCVIDVSLMSKADMRRFLADFAEQLYRANTDPLHVFAEEAHEYIPQRVDAGAARMVGAWEKLVKWGRTHGLGVTLITQRSASLNKDVLTQVETLIALRTSGPQDQAQIKAWVDEHDAGTRVVSELRKLASGEAFVLSPHWLNLAEPLRIRFHRRRTFDSGATPAAGETRIVPRSLAEVDLAALKEAMAETIENAWADDPKRLRHHIAELEKDLIRLEARATTPVIEQIAVPVLDADQLHAFIAAADTLITELRTIQAHLDAYPTELPAEGNQGKPTTRSSAPRATSTSSSSRRARDAGSSTPREKPSPAAMRETRPASGPGEALPKAQRAVLTVLAQHGTLGKTQVALRAGYAAGGGGFNNALGALRSAGYVEKGDPIAITDAGIAALGHYEPLPTGRGLVDHFSKLLTKAAREVIDVLYDAYPDGLTKEAIAERTPSRYAPTGGGFNNALGRLRALDLVITEHGYTTLAEELID